MKKSQLNRLPQCFKAERNKIVWFLRVCLIFQLAYKENTDQQRLFDYIRRLSGSKEFFIQKAAGWALRDYSKRNPEAVRAFIDHTPLPALTVREGGKYC